MSSQFSQSDKVVCIRGYIGPAAAEYHHPCGCPVKGDVYVVAEVCNYDFADGPGITLVIVGKPLICKAGFTLAGIDVGFCATRFRKLSDIQKENQEKQQAEHHGKEILG